ncbi:hypothetical protein [Halopiger aswanensis]|uniref:Uncharacterized protein n=1 Tax=Halopiger aswanensis TaxID=148449 RepID=A0A3R7GKN9_9EURY|nr:hypothetical protein [Halopiger aswanensis]RKD97479.1 hypothetical protein ATJ93_0465 [Halopiger aswanensis]
MSEQLHDRVTDLLNRADDQSGSLVAGSTADGDAESSADAEAANDVRDLAAEANDLLDSSDPNELLAAVGLETLPDGTEPNSIPEAIAKGDPNAVEDLQRLLHLARLADRGDGLEDAIGSVRAGIGESSDPDSGDPTETESESGDESAASSTDEASSSAAADKTSDAADATSDLEERLRSAMTSSLTDFSDDVSQLQERLESLGGGGDADESEATDEPDEAAAAEGERDTDPEDEARDESDDGLFGTDLGSGGNRGTSGSGTRYSTMAPPPSKRADMRGTARFSTIPDKIRD